MLAIVKNKIKAFIFLFATATLLSCNNQNHHTIRGSGNLVTQKRDITENFNKIEVSSAVEVIIEQADRTEIYVEAEDNLQNSIITKVKNGILYISRKNGNYNSFKTQKVFIKNPIIKELTANSASSIKTKNILKGENISLNASSAAKIEVELAIDSITANGSSASKIEIKGMALYFNADASSASKIDADDLLVNTVSAQSSSGSKISIHPILSLKADASSGGKIQYNHTPKQIEKSTSSGGDINLE